MDYGTSIFLTDETIGPAHLARLVEERGFRSLFVPEHTHIPTSRRTPFPGGEPLPKEYSHTFDPFVSLMAAAAATKRLKVGTGICLIIERDTITTAKSVATLDLLSNGRFEFGIGAGWNKEEIENNGTDFSRRFGVMRERMEAMTEICRAKSHNMKRWRDGEMPLHCCAAGSSRPRSSSAGSRAAKAMPELQGPPSTGIPASMSQTRRTISTRSVAT